MKPQYKQTSGGSGGGTSIPQTVKPHKHALRVNGARKVMNTNLPSSSQNKR